ncbi:MAG: hypothetical protein NZ551_01630 [Microscillaceae bacterium]|nr:hypothetical protein [Microscillaceae bacterium]MDW8459888.1 hypothetical protein [Cytophagales bacterium]
MKRKIIAYITALLLGCFVPLATLVAQNCDSKQFTDKCLEKLPDGYTFLKSYKVDGQNGTKKKIEYSYIFSKNTNYLINVANSDPESKGIIIKIFDSSRKEIASSFKGGKYYSGLNFKCNATGIYFITFFFENARDYCAGAVLSFKR